MKHKITWLVFLLIFLVVDGLHGGATTCVSDKKFKVKKACGVVTDTNGRFDVPNVVKGEYVLRARSPYFSVAWQPIIVT